MFSLSSDVLVHTLLPMLTAGDVLQLRCVSKKKKVQKATDDALHARVKKKYPLIIRRGPRHRQTIALVRWIVKELDHFKLAPLITATEALRRYDIKRGKMYSSDPITRPHVSTYDQTTIYQVRMQPKACKYSRKRAIGICFMRHKTLDAFIAHMRKRDIRAYRKNEKKATTKLNLFNIKPF